MRCLCLSILLAISSFTHALPFGNPSDASLLCEGILFCGEFPDPSEFGFWSCNPISLRLGYSGDFVFNRHLKIDICHADGGIVRDTEIFTNAGLLIFNYSNCVDLFFRLGATNLCLNANSAEFGISPNFDVGVGITLDLATATEFSWGIGGRATVYRCGCLRIGIEAEYFGTKPHINHICLGCQTGIAPNSCISLKYTEWQIGVGVSHQICCFVPYFAAKFSKSRVDMGDARFLVMPETGPSAFLTLHDLKQQMNGGMALGVTLVNCRTMSLTAEYRWPDEKAFHINGQIRF